MNKNAQPDRAFRQPVEHDLPPGNWEALPTSTYQGASAFLLTAGKERILLSGNKKVRYQSFGQGSLLLEDGPMHRFEVGRKEDGVHYICSALSEDGHQQLLPDFHLIDARAKIDGLCLSWIKTRESGNQALYAGSISLQRLSDYNDTFLLGDSSETLAHFAKIGSLGKDVSIIARNRQDVFAAFWIPKDTLLPQAIIQGRPSGEDILEKRKHLSYQPLDAQPIEVWFSEGRVRALAISEDKLICLEESLERGGESIQRTLEISGKNLSVAKDTKDNVFIAWNQQKPNRPSYPNYAPFTYSQYLIFTKTEQLLSGETAKVEIETKGRIKNTTIVIDEQERAYLVWQEEHSGVTEVFAFSWQSGKKECLLSFSGQIKSFAVSTDAQERVCGLCLTTDKKAFLFLPINPSLPVEPEPSIEKPRTWANVYNGVDQQTNHRGVIF